MRRGAYSVLGRFGHACRVACGGQGSCSTPSTCLSHALCLLVLPLVSFSA